MEKRSRDTGLETLFLNTEGTPSRRVNRILGLQVMSQSLLVLWSFRVIDSKHVFWTNPGAFGGATAEPKSVYGLNDPIT